MRPTTKVLLTACAMCTIAQAHRVARADQDPSANQVQDPNANPAQPNPPNVNPAQPNPPPLNPPSTNPTDQSPTDPSTTTTTTTTTTITPDSTTTTTVEPVPVVPVTDTGSDTGSTMYGYSWSDELMRSRIGVSAIVGGGVSGFTDTTMRDTTSNVGGLWDFRLTLGSHIPLGVELGYVGSATNLRGLPAQNGTLIGTTVEGALRYNVLPHYVFTPYVFGGIGWQRYDVTDANVTLSDSGMNDHDNLLEFPMGGGLAYRVQGFVVDLRGTFRAATDQNLVLKTPTASPTSNDFASMHTWEASAALGYEF